MSAAGRKYVINLAWTLVHILECLNFESWFCWFQVSYLCMLGSGGTSLSTSEGKLCGCLPARAETWTDSEGSCFNMTWPWQLWTFGKWMRSQKISPSCLCLSNKARCRLDSHLLVHLECLLFLKESNLSYNLCSIIRIMKLTIILRHSTARKQAIVLDLLQ